MGIVFTHRFLPAESEQHASREAPDAARVAEAELVGPPPETSSSADELPDSESWIAQTGLDTPLNELKRHARNPDEMWACEQFERARSAYFQRQFAEASSAIEQAFGGEGGSRPGHALESRAHFLRGALHWHARAQTGNAEPALQDFIRAFACADGIQPSAAGWAAWAASLACESLQRLDPALEWALRAAALLPRQGAAQFQLARVLLLSQRREAAFAALAQAVAIGPSWARAALRDPAFFATPEATIQLVSAERDRAGQRASQRLQRATALAAELGCAGDAFPSDHPLATVGEAKLALSLLQSARAAVQTHTLAGHVTAAEQAGAAAEMLQVLKNRSVKARLLAEDEVHVARERAAELQALQIGPYRLIKLARTQLESAMALLIDAERLLQQRTLAASLPAEQQARRANAALQLTLQVFRDAVLAEAERERRELRALANTAKLAPPQALSGALLGLVPALYLCAPLIGTPPDSTAVPLSLRIAFTVVMCSGGGAVLNLLLSPFIQARRSQSGIQARHDALTRHVEALQSYLQRSRSATAPEST